VCCKNTKILEPKKEEATGGRRKLRNDELQDFSSSADIIKVNQGG
jgi:hypothetical protein